MQTQNRRTTAKRVAFATLTLLALRIAAGAEQMYAPFSEYQMSRQAEIALARSAAPGTITQHATIEVLTPKGYEIAIKGDNAFVCMVLRSWSAAPDPADTRQANIRGPACFDAVASRTVVPAEELKVKLGLAGKSPEEIGREVAAQYKLGKLPKMEAASFAYMWSASQKIGPDAGPWHPHMMVYAPYYKNQFLGNNPVGNHATPFVVGDDTPYCIVMIPVDDKLAIKAAAQ
jgi:hypothetical protein